MKNPAAVFIGTPNADGHMSDTTRPQIRAALKRFAGTAVTISIEPYKEQRSKDQNAYIHAVPVTLLAEFLGYTIPEMKLILMGECFGWKLESISGKEIPVKPATSSMTIEECQYFIDWVIPWAAMKFTDSKGNAFQIPLPNEVAA